MKKYDFYEVYGVKADGTTPSEAISFTNYGGAIAYYGQARKSDFQIDTEKIVLSGVKMTKDDGTYLGTTIHEKRAF